MRIFVFFSFFISAILLSCSPADIENGGETSGQYDTVTASFYKEDSVHFGEATFYGIAAEGGNCGLPSPSPWDTLAGAMNHTDYRNSEICGACVVVSGPLDSVMIRINDQCPECKEGDIDLTPHAFKKIGPVEAGRMPIKWHFVPCPVSGNVGIYFTSGSSVYYAGMEVRNHRTPIRTVEILDTLSIWKEVPRKPYNRFEARNLWNPPWTLRITDVFGSAVTDSMVLLLPDSVYEMSSQFPFAAP